MGNRLGFGCILWVLSAISGCSSTETVFDPNASVSSFCGNWAKAACSDETVLACSGAAKVDAALTDSCVTSQRLFCEGLVPRTGYSSLKATQCLNAVQAAYKDARLSAEEVLTVRHLGEPCNHLIKGPQRAAESCSKDDDCNTLDNYLCVMKGGQGSCQIPTMVDNGTSCAAPDAACNPGFYCSGGDDPNCVQSKALGKTCSADFECAAGLVCDSDTNKCSARVSPESCSKDDECATSVCDIPVNSSTGRCVSAITLSASSGICEDLR
ncbi:MAG TPA: hypothetical protein VFK05_07235 [Polyangiaceae bacterium]|nr:hypothetical protein [Polyangiaceae bacterium]